VILADAIILMVTANGHADSGVELNTFLMFFSVPRIDFKLYHCTIGVAQM